MTRFPTERQAFVLYCLDSMTQRKGYPPTVRELMEAAGLSSTNAMAGHLMALERKGFVTSLPGKARTLRVTEAAKPFLKTK